MRRGRAKRIWPAETIAGVVKDYQSGAKTSVICYEFKLRVDQMYDILRDAGVDLRSKKEIEERMARLRCRIVEILRIRLYRLQNKAYSIFEQDPCMLSTELARLADHGDELDTGEVLDKVWALVLVALEKEPEATIGYLGFLTKPFSPNDLLNTAVEHFIDKILLTMPDEFEQVEVGLWRVKAK